MIGEFSIAEFAISDDELVINNNILLSEIFNKNTINLIFTLEFDTRKPATDA